MDATKIKNKLVEFLKQPFIYIIIICTIFQFKMYSTVRESLQVEDSKTYIGYALNTSILRGEVDENRTPVYPYFIKIVKKLCGEENLANNVANAQKILFIAIVILFYLCVNSLTKNKIIISLATLIFGISPSIILWNVSILTEAISIAEMVILALLTIRYLKKPSYILSGSIGIMILAMIMTRPAFIYILPIYLLFWILKFFFDKEEKRKVIVGIVSCMICICALLGYCTLMNNQYGKFSLTRISNLNNVLSVVKSGAYKKSSNEQMVKVIDEEYSQNKNIWEINDVLNEKFTEEELKELTKTTLKTPEHLKFLVKKTIYVGTLNIGINYIDRSGLAEDGSFYKLSYKNIEEVILPVNFAILYAILACSIIYLIFNLFKSKKIDWIVAFFTILISANILTLIVGAPEEEQRLFAASIPLVILYIAYIAEKIIEKRKKE